MTEVLSHIIMMLTGDVMIGRGMDQLFDSHCHRHDIPPQHRSLAHTLIDQGAANMVHFHSSHHPKAIEVYRHRLVLYGAGDLINDYEGIFRRHLKLRRLSSRSWYDLFSPH